MEAVAIIVIAFALLAKIKLKALDKLADDIFFSDMLEKKIAKFNKAIGTAFWRLLLAKQDDYYTKNDFIFEVCGF